MRIRRPVDNIQAGVRRVQSWIYLKDIPRL